MFNNLSKIDHGLIMHRADHEIGSDENSIRTPVTQLVPQSNNNEPITSESEGEYRASHVTNGGSPSETETNQEHNGTNNNRFTCSMIAPTDNENHPNSSQMNQTESLSNSEPTQCRDTSLPSRETTNMDNTGGNAACANSSGSVTRQEIKDRLLIIINNFEFARSREIKSARIDSERLSDSMKRKNFSVNQNENLNLVEMVKKFEEIFAMNVNQSECLWISLHSHGGRNYVLCSDDEKFYVEQIFQIYHRYHHPSQDINPKILVIEACKSLDVVSTNTGAHISSEREGFLIVYSTSHLSCQHILQGSYFIKHFCEVLDKKCCQTDDPIEIEDFFNMIRRELIKDIGQVPEVEKNWSFEFYLT